MGFLFDFCNSILINIVQDDDYCTPQSAKLFQAALDLGYEILEPSLPLKRMKGCANKYWTIDLLLIQRSHLLSWMEENKVNIPNFKSEYEIILMDGEFDIVTNQTFFGF